MEQFEEIVRHLENGAENDYAENEDNGRMVEVANMAGGRYLCTENGDVMRQTDSPEVAAMFLLGKTGTRKYVVA